MKTEQTHTKDIIVEKAKAGFAALYLLSPEDQRGIGDLKEVAKDLDRRFLVWTAGKGFCSVDDKGKFITPIEDTEGAGAALTHIVKDAPDNRSNSQGTVYVLRNFHHFLDDPRVQSTLVDMLPDLKIQKRMIVILSSALKIPQELESVFTLVETKLPNKAELREVLNGIVKATGSSLKKNGYKTKDGKQLDASNFELPEAHRDKMAEAALGLTTTEAENAMSLSFIRPLSRNELDKLWDPKIVMEEKCENLKKAGLLQYYPPDVNLDDVGGMGNLKAWLKPRLKAFSDSAKKYGLRSPKGVFLVGPPGTGKSLGAKATAGFFKMPLLSCSMGRIFGSLVGESEANMRRVLSTAEAVAPCVLWFDEIEKGLAGSSGGGANDSGTSARVLGQLLTWMQEKTSDVFVYATANDVTGLPPELMRKGRFDELFSVTLPDEQERVEIFRIHVRKRGREKLTAKLQIDDLAKLTKGFTGSEIEAVIDQAMFTAFDENEREMNTLDLQEAVKTTVPLSRTMAAYIKAVETWCKERTRPAGKLTSSDAEIGGGRVLDA